ncbi:MAG: hypothetical protein L6408_06460 [Nanoarchaeota archaeon]|nr:hypothetical protein [Nanoarchaeota archaeon]
MVHVFADIWRSSVVPNSLEKGDLKDYEEINYMRKTQRRLIFVTFGGILIYNAVILWQQVNREDLSIFSAILGGILFYLGWTGKR